MNSEKYPIIQINGQRIYQPSTLIRQKLPKGSEIFVGNLPRDLYEDELIPIFLQIGPIYQLRLMMDFSGKTRGFCFVHFFNAESANLAVKLYNEKIISSKTRQSYITVHICLDNCRLFFGNVPKYNNAEEIKTELLKIVDGITKVIVYPDHKDVAKNRGFAFVEFESHAMAAIARRKFLAGVVDLWNNCSIHEKMYVEWAEPEPIVNPMVLTEVKILYLRNLPCGWTLQQLKKFLSNFFETSQIEKIYKKDYYAFVHFSTREAAKKAMEILETMTDLLLCCGQRIEVEWARPCIFSKKYKKMQLPNNLCTSVPPKSRKLVYESKRKIKKALPMRFPSSNSSESSSIISKTDEEQQCSLWTYFNQLSLSNTV